MAEPSRNVLYYGDNLDVLRRHVADESTDLVYLDPPFNSNASYNVLFGHADGTQAAAQIKAFDDTWHWDQTAASAFEQVVKGGGLVAQALAAFQTLLGPSTMLAYLSMMAPRLVRLRRALKSTGSIYLHCDPTASHYLKLLMDSIFGAENFRNEIVWRRTGSHNSAKRYGPLHDIILFYSKAPRPYFRSTFRPYLKGHVDSYFKKSDSHGRYWTNALTGAGTRKGESGSPWRQYDPTDVGRHWAVPGAITDGLDLDPGLTQHEKLDALDAAGFVDYPKDGSVAMPTYRQYLADSPGIPLQDIWAYQPHTSGVLYGTDEAIDEDVRWLGAQGDKERLGYPTQKPRGLLERIIESSCPPNGVVLDPFCGCGTTIAAAANLGRQWIGIDLTYLSISLIKSRLTAMGSSDYTVLGEPTTADDAADLAKEDPYQFQWWALGLIGARPADGKKGADHGIDGRLFFFDGDQKPKQVIVSVKAGKVQVSHVRDLRGVVDREKAEIGVLISFNEPTHPMRAEAASAGFYTSPWGQHPRLQLLTVAELLAGERIDMPAGGAHMTQVALPPTPEELVHPDQLSLGG